MYNINKEGDKLARQVKCKICGEKIASSTAYCIEKINEKTGKKTRSYYCSKEEYDKDKYQKSLWKEILLLYDYILGYTCISKTKVNQIKEIEENYSREQLYNCLRANADSIKMYLNQKDIYEEYGKLSYITNAIKNKIKDYSQNEQIQIGSTYEPMDCLDETDEDIFRRLEHDRNNQKETILDIIRRINGDGDK